jgi:predicted dehydrogenase
LRGDDAPVQAFRSVDALLEAGAADAAVVASRTEDHDADARSLIEGGLRVLLE